MNHDPNETSAARRPPEPGPVAARPVPLDRTIEQMRARTAAKLNSLDTLQEALQEAGHLSILQILDILDQATRAQPGSASPFDAQRPDPATPGDQPAARSDDVEDL